MNIEDVIKKAKYAVGLPVLAFLSGCTPSYIVGRSVDYTAHTQNLFVEPRVLYVEAFTSAASKPKTFLGKISTETFKYSIMVPQGNYWEIIEVKEGGVERELSRALIFVNNNLTLPDMTISKSFKVRYDK